MKSVMKFRTGVLSFMTLFLIFLCRGERGRMNEAEKKELEGIQYIQEKNDMNDMKKVLALYNKLTERELFHTQTGIAFMEQLRERLIASPEIKNQDIRGYKEDARKEKENLYKYKYYNSLIINIILAVALILGFFITTNSKNVNILNYENRLIDKYSAWEEQLKERESIVTEREKALIQP